MTKLILLAAGSGTRLRPYTDNKPKPLVEIKPGASILDESLREIIKSNIFSEVIIVVGYLAEQIEEKVKPLNMLGIKTIYTPFYEDFSNLYSLWCAKEEMEGDIMITNADNIIKADVFKRLDMAHGIALAISKNPNLKEDDMKVMIDKRRVINVSKGIKDSNYESVSLVKISRNNIPDFKRILDKMIREKTDNEFLHKKSHWPTIFYELYKSNIFVESVEIDKRDWAEIDFHGDLLDLMLKEKQ